MFMDHAGSWWAMWAMMVVFWTILIAGTWVIIASLRQRGERPAADDILLRRLARGEIGRDEYRERKQELHQRS